MEREKQLVVSTGNLLKNKRLQIIRKGEALPLPFVLVFVIVNPPRIKPIHGFQVGILSGIADTNNRIGLHILGFNLLVPETADGLSLCDCLDYCFPSHSFFRMAY